MEITGKNKKCVVLLGPTATGKTSFGVCLAEKLNAEIISADSRQVYRGMDIGSGKDLADYDLPNGKHIPYHLIDIADPVTDGYSLADFILDSGNAVNQICGRGHLPFFIGGTALYLHSVLSGYRLHGGTPDEQYRRELHALSTEQLRQRLMEMYPNSEILKNEPDNRIRLVRGIEQKRAEIIPPASSKERPPETDREYLILGLYRPRIEVRRRIEERLDERLENGMLAEVASLHENGVSWEKLESFGLEYRYIALHLQGKMTFQEMRTILYAKICQFAKRQDSWFRKMERDGLVIHWVRPNEMDKALKLCSDFLNNVPITAPDFRLSETFYGK